MTEVVVGGIALAAGWLGRGFVLWRRAKRDGRTMTVIEAARLVIGGGRA